MIHLAADTRVDHCESHPEETFLVNAAGTALIARACRTLQSRLILMSTDYVFDGAKRTPYREDQPTGSLNVYGRSKEEAERSVLSTASDRS
jgi:dTDP-4-dehydrorhamnose reductase